MPSRRSAGPSWGRSRSRWSSSACSWSWRSWARSTSRGRTSEPERVPHARRAGLRDRPLRRPHAAQRDRDPARDRADAQRREHQPGGLRPLRRRGQAAGAVSISAIAVAFLAALFSWFVWKGDAHVQTWAWIPADEGPTATVGALLDPLSNAMLVLVTLVSLLVQIYSLAYLRDERAPSLGRYYTCQSLFAFSMLGLVLSPSFIQMFVFWELVGL